MLLALPPPCSPSPHAVFQPAAVPWPSPLGSRCRTASPTAFAKAAGGEQGGLGWRWPPLLEMLFRVWGSLSYENGRDPPSAPLPEAAAGVPAKQPSLSTGGELRGRRGAGAAPLPAARRRSPPAERRRAGPDVAVPVAGGRAGGEAGERPSPALTVPEPGRAGGAGSRGRSMEGEKRPRSSPGPGRAGAGGKALPLPLPPRRPRSPRAPPPVCFQAASSVLCKQIAASGGETSSRLQLNRKRTGLFFSPHPSV